MEVSAIVLGTVVGLILALAGAGGGILAVPLLVFGQHLSIMQAAPVGLIAVGVSSALGAALSLRDGTVRYRAAAMIGIVGMVLTPCGVLLARVIPNELLTICFSVVMAYVAVRMFNHAHHSLCAAGAPLHAPLQGILDPGDGPRAWTTPCAWALASVGALAGVLSGLLGVGGGFVVVPSLTRLTNLTSQSILATSLAVIALVSAGSVTVAAVQGSIAWDIAFPFTVGAVIAMLAGRMIAARLTGARLQEAFALTSGAVALLLLARGLGWMA